MKMIQPILNPEAKGVEKDDDDHDHDDDHDDDDDKKINM